MAEGRILVIASSLFVTNPLARAGAFEIPGAQTQADARREGFVVGYAQQYLTTMILTVKNALDWATLDSGLLACADPLPEHGAPPRTCAPAHPD